MKILYDYAFDKALKKLPNNIQRLYRKQETIFRKDWHDHRLHVKKLTDHPFPFSFRITRAYRVLFIFIDIGTVFLATISHRKNIYK